MSGDNQDGVVYVYMDGAQEGSMVDTDSLGQVLQLAQQQTAGEGNQQQTVYVLRNLEDGQRSSDGNAEVAFDQKTKENNIEGKKAVAVEEDDLSKEGTLSEAQPSVDNKSSVAIQANDFEIERRSGVVPARRRVIPAKFRDYRNPDNEHEESDEDYNPALDNRPENKAKRTFLGNKSAKKPGRPRKFRVDHSYEKLNDSKQNWETQIDGSKAGNEDTAPRENKSQTNTTGAYTPRRGRPPKEIAVATGAKNFKCLTCDRRFSQKGNLKTHMRTHTDERPFVCDMVNCTKTFRTNESLRRHKMAHMGIKLFECEICKQRFSSNVALTEHTARHTDSKPHNCEVCGRNFRQLSCLKRHQTTHSSETPYECQICGKKFSLTSYLKSHMRSHTGEKPYKCQICEKTFAHHSDLNRHKVTHLGNKPYGCDVCGARFSDPSSRRRHIKEHSGFKPYTCQLCSETFKRAGQLKGHLNKKHMNVKDEVTITRTGPNQTMEFQFKNSASSEGGNIATGVDKKVLEAQREFVNRVTQGAAPNQKHQIVLQESGDGSGAFLRLEEGQAQVIAGGSGPLEQLVMSSQGGEYQHITEETQRIIQQIKSQLESQAANQPDGQPLQVAYQVIHDDDNQQVLEIQYHQVMEVDEAVDSHDSSNQALQEVDGSAQKGEAVLHVAMDPNHTPAESSLTSQLPSIQEQTLVHDAGPAGDLVVQSFENSDMTTSKESSTMQQFSKSEVDHTGDHAESTAVATSPLTLVGSDKSTGNLDYVANPDFNSQEYYNWLSNFTELCKLVPMPLDVDLFQKISQVHKSLSDVLATPSGILTNRENFTILMNISKELNSIINEHLAFVLKNLDEG